MLSRSSAWSCAMWMVIGKLIFSIFLNIASRQGVTSVPPFAAIAMQREGFSSVAESLVSTFKSSSRQML